MGGTRGRRAPHRDRRERARARGSGRWSSRPSWRSRPARGTRGPRRGRGGRSGSGSTTRRSSSRTGTTRWARRGRAPSRSGWGSASRRRPDALVHALSLDAADALRAPCPGRPRGASAGTPRARRSPASRSCSRRSSGTSTKLEAAGVNVAARRVRGDVHAAAQRGRRAGADAVHLDLHAMERLALEARARAGRDVVAICGKVGGFDSYAPAFGPLERAAARGGGRGARAQRVRVPGPRAASPSCATPTPSTCSSAWRRSSASGCATCSWRASSATTARTTPSCRTPAATTTGDDALHRRRRACRAATARSPTTASSGRPWGREGYLVILSQAAELLDLLVARELERRPACRSASPDPARAPRRPPPHTLVPLRATTYSAFARSGASWMTTCTASSPRPFTGSAPGRSLNARNASFASSASARTMATSRQRLSPSW